MGKRATICKGAGSAALGNCLLPRKTKKERLVRPLEKKKVEKKGVSLDF